MRPSTIRFATCAAALVVLASPLTASACVACFGQSDDAMAKGMYMGVFTLLFVVTCVLCGIAGVGIFIVRRTARLARAEAEDGQTGTGASVANSLSHSTH